jgi:hypothetical protein
VRSVDTSETIHELSLLAAPVCGIWTVTHVHPRRAPSGGHVAETIRSRVTAEWRVMCN